MNIQSICKNGIYLPHKNEEEGQWEIICLHSICFTHSYDEDYFFSPDYEERCFLLQEANKTWFTTYEKALAYCNDAERPSIDPIAALRKYAQVDKYHDHHDPMCRFEGIDFSYMDDDEYDAVLDWLGVEKDRKKENE